MKLIAQIIGLLAVGTFLWSYQQKKREHIIWMNFASRCLYILQYLLLGAFTGAVLDILAAGSSAFSGKKHTDFIKKYEKPIVVILNAAISAVGLLIAYFNQSLLDLFALAGVLFEINALWLTRERAIRWVSLFAAPCWFIYNFLSGAYGSAIGNVFTIASIVVAMIRYKNSNK